MEELALQLEYFIHHVVEFSLRVPELDLEVFKFEVLFFGHVHDVVDLVPNDLTKLLKMKLTLLVLFL